jgi:hypothetical protein
VRRRFPSADEFRGIGAKRSPLEVAGGTARYADTSAALAGLEIGGGAVLALALFLFALGRYEVTDPRESADEPL